MYNYENIDFFFMKYTYQMEIVSITSFQRIETQTYVRHT